MKNKLVKIILPIFIVMEFISVFFLFKSYDLNNNEISGRENSFVNKKSFAMFINNSTEEEKYSEYFGSTFPSGYTINLEKSKCLDTDGKLVENVLSLRENKLVLDSVKTVFCYLYFDLDNNNLSDESNS